MQNLKEELRQYYQKFRLGGKRENMPTPDREARERILSGFENFLAENPDTEPPLIKAELHALIAENFVPRLFRHSPFYFEMGMRPSELWGIPTDYFLQPASRMHNLFSSKLTDNRQLKDVYSFEIGGRDIEKGIPCLWSCNAEGFDEDHHCPGYSKILRIGINGLLSEIKQLIQSAGFSKAEKAQLEAMRRSCDIMLKIAERFALHAVQMLENEKDPQVAKKLELIATTARRVPAEPPRTFYEGLAALCFLREVIASLEGIGISVIGHPDRQLIELYRADLKAGRITEKEARDLVARWMLPADIRGFVREREWPETSTCLMLGGCDEEGKTVYNELTEMFIQVHCEQNLLNPKLNCRYNEKSPNEYLRLVAEKSLAGHNNFALLSDDTLIPAQVKHGKTVKQARLYVNGGCQETICEGVEHSAGAYFYFNMAGLFNLFFCGSDSFVPDLSTTARVALPAKAGGSASFEGFYRSFLRELEKAVRCGAEWLAFNGRRFPQINPCPLFSSTLEGCIEKATDYTAGGALYNPSGVTFVGLGDVINSLNAVRMLVFEDKCISMEDLQKTVSDNWGGAELLRQKALGLPRFGHGNAEVDELGSRLAADVAEFVRKTPNERGYFFQPSFFVYWSFKHFGDATGATPDGRRKGDLLCQGISPHRDHAPWSLSSVVESLGRIDFTDYPGNAVLDLQFPVGSRIPAEAMVSLMRTASRAGIPTLQFNCVDVARLRDAQERPEENSDIIVRISGLSAVFVQLKKEVQDEIISRANYVA